jgi:gamma-glutamyltranspeptidase
MLVAFQRSFRAAIVLDAQGRSLLVLGSPGGRGVSTVFQIVANAIDFGGAIQEAAACGRIHHQGRPDGRRIERRPLAGDRWAAVAGVSARGADAGATAA